MGYEGSVPFIIDVNADFDGSGAKADVDINVKVASKQFTCKGEAIAETDAQVTFPNAPNDGDCLGDGIRSDSKDPSKYIINKNSDGTLTYKSDGYPDLKMKKKSLMANDKLTGSYEGSVPFIIDVEADFDGSDKADVDVNVKVASVRITCPGESIAEDDSTVTFPNAINKNSDGTLTYKSDGY